MSLRPISRRSFVRTLGAGAGAAFFASSLRGQRDEAATQVVPPPANDTLYRFRVGEFRAVSILCGILDVVAEQPFWAPQADPVDFARALEDHCQNGRVRMPFNVLLLSRGDEHILVDTGPGPRPEAWFDLRSNLARLGLAPDDITAVVLTHAHYDHIGGVTDGEGRPAFRKACHYVLPEEIDFWTGEAPDFSRMRMGPTVAARMIETARRGFDPVEFTRVGPASSLPEGLTPVLSPGHTPGQMTILIESAGERLYHVADLAHSHAIMLPHPGWTVASDTDEAVAAATRGRVFKRICDEGLRTFGFHMPYPGLGRLRPNGEGYRWVPEEWQAGL